MEVVYLTSNIFYKNNHLYSRKNKYNVLIKKENWCKYLSSYGWRDIDLQWSKLLNLGSEVNSFGLLECGGQGDCLFHCLAEGLNNILNPNENMYDSQQLRVLASEQINKDNFQIILETYQLESDGLDWNPQDIQNYQELQEEIKQGGHNFWGDHLIIQLLEKALHINIIILDSLNVCIYNTCSLFNKSFKTIFLYYQDNFHFQLIGYFDQVMKTVFNYHEIPPSLLKIITN